jgi:hypothetical protein
MCLVSDKPSFPIEAEKPSVKASAECGQSSYQIANEEGAHRMLMSMLMPPAIRYEKMGSEHSKRATHGCRAFVEMI